MVWLFFHLAFSVPVGIENCKPVGCIILTLNAQARQGFDPWLAVQAQCLSLQCGEKHQLSEAFLADEQHLLFEVNFV